MSNLINYRFLVPNDEKTKKYFKYTFKENWQSSDGSPFCHIDEGLLLEISLIKSFPEGLSFETYEISDRFIDTSDFITAFWDGDCEDDDFIYEEKKLMFL